MGELKFIGKRVVYLAVMLFGVATLVFILTKMIPGDPVVANLSQRALNDPEIVAAYRAKHGLDRPLIVQYIYYIRDLLHFDLGTSIRTSRPVLDDLARCYPATLELALFSTVRHLILPSIVLAAFTMGLITRTTRSNLLDALSTDYVRTAKAKGLNSICLILKHALGNALIPVMTVIGLGLGNLLGGMVLVETIFKWPGVGQFAYESVMAADYPAIIGVALLIALNYMIINTVVDILYGIIDPRVRCN